MQSSHLTTLTIIPNRRWHQYVQYAWFDALSDAKPDFQSDSINTLLIVSQPSLYANVLLAARTYIFVTCAWFIAATLIYTFPVISRLKPEKPASERESTETSATGSPERREKVFS